MITIRSGTFETNSSSSHSITVMRKKDWEAFKNFDKVIDEHVNFYSDEDGMEYLDAQLIKPEKFISFDELKEKVKGLEIKSSFYKEIQAKILGLTNQELKDILQDKDNDDYDDLQSFFHEFDIVVYEKTEDWQNGWGTARVTEVNFGEPIVVVNCDIGG